MTDNEEQNKIFFLLVEGEKSIDWETCDEALL